ncbi:hypothetical protein QR685DRAFT_519294 [Neurospora intermedia]|uniref:Secreted protein n=1 Tax=Neurospora intermedia TaxID=5142 RepID=A0ABR3DI58_NEUIN
MRVTVSCSYLLLKFFLQVEALPIFRANPGQLHTTTTLSTMYRHHGPEPSIGSRHHHLDYYIQYCRSRFASSLRCRFAH